MREKRESEYERLNVCIELYNRWTITDLVHVYVHCAYTSNEKKERMYESTISINTDHLHVIISLILYSKNITNKKEKD